MISFFKRKTQLKPMVKNKCIVCKSTKYGTFYEGIFRCRECGHTFSDLDLNYRQLSKIYSNKYFFGEEYNNYLADRNTIEKNFKQRLKVLETFLVPDKHKYLLEIGCAYGFFLNMVYNRFEKVLGFDINKEGVLYARKELNVDAINGNFLEYDFGDRTFDIVAMWDTIEHFNNPDLLFNKISNITGVGALITITTGDIDSLNSRVRGNKWRLIHPPTHLHYFSKKTITKLLNKYGFEIIYNRYCGFHRSIDVIAYRLLELQRKQSKLYSILRKLGLTNTSLYLNLYDIMYVIARKC